MAENSGSHMSTGAAVAGAALLAGGYWFGLRPYLAKKKAEADLTADQQSTIKGAGGKQITTIGGTKVSGMNLSTIVVDLHEALHPGYFTFTKSDSAMGAFKRIPFGTRADPGMYVHQVEKMYLDKYSQNLKDDLSDHLGEVKFMKIKYWFE